MNRYTIIILTTVLIFSLQFTNAAKAAVITDINGTYSDLGKEGSVYGGGIALLWDAPRYLDDKSVFFYINSSFLYSSENKDEATETVRTYVPVSAGMEYRYQVLMLPLYVTGSAGAGISYFEKQGPAQYGPFIDPSKTQVDTAYGPYTDIMLGVNYVLSQRVAVFARGGYQASFYDEKNIGNPGGFVISIGLRIPISGTLRSIE